MAFDKPKFFILKATIRPSPASITLFHLPPLQRKTIAMEHKVKKMTNVSGKKLIALWKQTSKSRKLFCDRQGLNYNSFITKHKQYKAKAKTETSFSQTQKTLRQITDPYYYYAGFEILCCWSLTRGLEILSSITQDWKSCAAGKQKPVFRKLKRRYDGSQMLTIISQDWKSGAADL